MTKVEKAIRQEFPGKNNHGLRIDIREAALTGSVIRLAAKIAFTASGLKSLEAIEKILQGE
jgi:ribonuclease I